MKILILGSKGFIGNNLLDYFRKKKHIVYGSDIFSDELDEKYIQFSSVSSNFDSLFKSFCFDLCINCSGASNVLNSFNKHELDFQLNSINVFNILNSIKTYNSNCKFINLTSAAVYGNPTILPVRESDQINPISPYGFHKLISEIILSEYYKIYDIQTCSLRLFSVYGIGLNKQILWDIFQKWKSDENIEFHGSGNETRDFIYIDDLIKVIEIIIENGDFKGEVINVANGEEIKIKDIVKLMLDELGIRDFNFNNVIRTGDPLRWKADISKIKSMGYLKSINIEDGIKKYVIWLKDLK
ncbi:MAG: SDR family oxidoreductase [Bacteroidia bacterium]|nr:SDR family oxidoreductase [Bacteroidia bacterium]